MTFDLAQMIADREAGTPGEWRIRVNKGDDEVVCDVSICGDIFVLADLNGPQYAHQYPNARRIARVPAMEAEITRLTARVAELEGALRPFSEIGVGSNPDYQPQIRLDRDAILKARAALATPDQIAALAAERAATVTVNKLPWESRRISSNWERLAADTLFGGYEILEHTDGKISWNVTFFNADEPHLQYAAKSIEAAKAAAQADYDARIRSAVRYVEQPL